MLEINNIDVAYGKAKILHGLSLTAKPGEILCLLGRNGAGKTTTMQAIMGLLRLKAGSISLAGEDLSKLPAHEVPRRGIGYVPQGRRLFSELTVAENIEIGLMVRGKGDETRNRVLDIFPRLRERLDQAAETLSGGEQQMLATARALCIEPSVLLLDEPTTGLDPTLRRSFYDTIMSLKDEGVTVLLASHALSEMESRVDRIAIMSKGRLMADGSMTDLRKKAQLPARIRLTTDDGAAGRAAEHLQGADIRHVNGRTVEFDCASENKMELVRRVTDIGVTIEDMEIELPNLDRIYELYQDNGEASS